jgi:hypothetical protein
MLATTRRVIRITHNLVEFLEPDAETMGVSKQVQELKTVNDETTVLGVKQDDHHYGFKRESGNARSQKKILIDAHIKPILALAKIVLRDNPEFRSGLRSDVWKSYEGALFVANALAERLEPFKATFVQAGMRENFVEEMRSSADQLEATLATKAHHVAQRSNATTALAQHYARGRDLVRFIDAMVKSRLAGSPEKLSEWRSLTRFAQPAKSSASTDGGTPAVTPVSGGGTAPDTRMA